MPRSLLVALAAAALTLCLSPASARAGEWVVQSSADSGETLTLRQAIQNANEGPGPHTIRFAGPMAISLASPLPALVQEILVDGAPHAVTVDGPPSGAGPLFDLAAFGAELRNLTLGGGVSPLARLGGDGGHTISHSRLNVPAGGTAVSIESGANLVARNELRGPGARGVVVLTGLSTVWENSMTSFPSLGLDLGSDGITANDPLDADSGPNGLQNFPQVTSAVADADGVVTIAGTLHSTPGRIFWIDVYASAACDGTGHGPSERWLGFATTGTDANGNATWSDTFTDGVGVGDVLTAQAQDIDAGQTSEFSACSAPVSGPADMEADQSLAPEQPVADDPVTLTMTATNRGPAPATGVVLRATLRGPLEVDTAPGCTVDDREVTCRRPGGALGPGASWSAAIELTPTAGGTLRSLVEASASEEDTVPENNSSELETPIDLPPPEVGRSANAAVVKGTVRLKLPGSKQFAMLEDADQIPVGSVLDTRRGRIRLTTATGASSGATQSGVFHAGVFQVRQNKGRRPVTEARLRGGRFRKVCRKSAQTSLATTAKKRRKRGGKKVRRLWGRGKGRFRTRGRNAAATVRGTRWLVEDRCGGTQVRVRRGKVKVRDFARRRTVLVKKGKRYWAPARR